MDPSLQDAELPPGVEAALRRRFPVAQIQPRPLAEQPLLLCRLCEAAGTSRGSDLAVLAERLHPAAERQSAASTPQPLVVGRWLLGCAWGVRPPEELRAEAWAEVCDAASAAGERRDGLGLRGTASAVPRTPTGASSGRSSASAPSRGAHAVDLEAAAMQAAAGWGSPRKRAADRAALRARRFERPWWPGWLEAVESLGEAGGPEDGDAARRRLLGMARAHITRRAQSIPDDLRPALWLWMATQGDADKLGSPLYRALCRRASASPEAEAREQEVRRQIFLDLQRTPTELFLGGRRRGEGAAGDGEEERHQVDLARRRAADRILLAFSRHRPSIGYCQGLNFIAASLVSVLDEQSAFTVFCGLLESVPSDLHCSDPDALRRCRQAQERQVLDTLAAERPELHRHLAALEVDPNFFLPRWLSCLFAPSLRSGTVLRLWDFVLAGGAGDDVALRLALAVLVRAEAKLMAAADVPAVLEVLSSSLLELSPGDINEMLCEEWPVERLEPPLSGTFNSAAGESLAEGAIFEVSSGIFLAAEAEDASTEASTLHDAGRSFADAAELSHGGQSPRNEFPGSSSAFTTPSPIQDAVQQAGV